MPGVTATIEGQPYYIITESTRVFDKDRGRRIPALRVLWTRFHSKQLFQAVELPQDPDYCMTDEEMKRQLESRDSAHFVAACIAGGVGELIVERPVHA